MGEITHFEKYSYYARGVGIEIDFSRIEALYQRAQYWLDSQIMTDMVPLMPHMTGTFINVTRMASAALAGSGKVIAAASPMGRFLYMGKVMVDPDTNSPWARPGAKKVVTDRPIVYSNPRAVPLWFERAKELHKNEWIRGVKSIIGGNNG